MLQGARDAPFEYTRSRVGATGASLSGGGDLLKINRIGFGTIHITTERSFGPPRPDAVELLRKARDAGVEMFDTADTYGPGHAEETIREALSPYTGLTIATKGGYRCVRLHRDDWHPAAHPDQLRAALDASLRRLRVERIQLYYLHCSDKSVPYAESVGALRDAVDAGKIHRVGVSRVSSSQLRIAQDILGERLAAVQNWYNVLHPLGVRERDEPDTETVLAMCERAGLAFVAWEPLGGGGLAAEATGLGSPLLSIAQAHSASPEQIALAALLQRPPKSIIVIPGTSSADHLESNMASGRITLTREEFDALWRKRSQAL